jgi:hypothetical protein
MNTSKNTQTNVDILLSKKMEHMEHENNKEQITKVTEKGEKKKKKKRKKKKMSYKNMMSEILKPSGNNDIKDKKIITRGLGGGRYSKLNKI